MTREVSKSRPQTTEELTDTINFEVERFRQSLISSVEAQVVEVGETEVTDKEGDPSL
jgi:hypothetical protein